MTRCQDFLEFHQDVLVPQKFVFLTHVNHFDDLLCCLFSNLNLNFNPLDGWSGSCNGSNEQI